jgi:hypothetical protein
VAVRSAIEYLVLEDDRDNLGILDAGDDLDGPAALLATFKVGAEHAFQALRPTHRDVLWCGTAGGSLLRHGRAGSAPSAL